MNDRETIQLLQAEAERSQALIAGLKEAAEKLTIRITDADILAARYQAEREDLRTELLRTRLATAATLTAAGSCCPECEAGTLRAKELLGLNHTTEIIPEDEMTELIKALDILDVGAPGCTGQGAIWCPNCGACLCGRAELVPVEISDTCRLHRPGSSHATTRPGVEAVEEPIDAEAARCIETARMVVGDGVRAHRRRIESAEAEAWLLKADNALADMVGGGGTLTPRQAAIFKRIMDAGMQDCRPCGGSGSMLISGGALKLIHRLPEKCPSCDGAGQVSAANMMVCPDCYGSGGPDGTTGLATCQTCQGKGEIKRPQPEGAADGGE